MEIPYSYTYPETNISIGQVQDIEFSMLKEFDRICRKHNIPYQIFGGTLLGAVRHKGFIPWDDDIDVAMLREDFDRFIAVAEDEIDSSIFVQTCFTDPDAVLQFAKLRKNGTVFEDVLNNNAGSHTGIWIDVFPFDNVKLDSASAKKMGRRIKFLYALTTSSMWTRVKYASTVPIVVARSFLFLLVKILGKSRVDRRLLKEFRKYDDEETEYVSHLTNGIKKKTFIIPGQKGKVLSNVQKKEDFLTLCELEFNGSKFFAPAKYDEVLTDTYGNYMEFPPEEKRIPAHGICKISIGEKKE